MEKTIYYKTLSGLMKKTRNNLTFNEFKNKKFSHIKKGWCKFNMPEEEYLRVLSMFIEYLNFKVKNYGGDRPDLVLYNNLRYVKSYGILDRLWIQPKYKKKSEYTVIYCAGQCGTSEERTIKKILNEACN